MVILLENNVLVFLLPQHIIQFWSTCILFITVLASALLRALIGILVSLLIVLDLPVVSIIEARLPAIALG